MLEEIKSTEGSCSAGSQREMGALIIAIARGGESRGG